MPAELFVVATPIGNLGDMTLRGIEVLKNVSLIASEDTRVSLKLLTHFGIKKPLFRYDENIHHQAAPKLVQFLQEGKSVALITDAGTPGISDPGSRLIQEVWKSGFKVTPIPGASSVTAAISASGWAPNGFIFLGFLPRKGGPAKRLLQESFGLGRTIVIMESPFRVQETLKRVNELNPKAFVFVTRELTKIHEEIVQGPVEEVLKDLERRTLKGEIVILIGPGPKNQQDN